MAKTHQSWDHTTIYATTTTARCESETVRVGEGGERCRKEWDKSFIQINLEITYYSTIFKM